MNFPSLFTMSIYLKKCIVPQSVVMTQSDWPVATVNRQLCRPCCSCQGFMQCLYQLSNMDDLEILTLIW